MTSVCAERAAKGQAKAFRLRELPADEWCRLRELEWCELRDVIDRCDPVFTRVLVVEREGAIIGAWAELTIRHVEGLSIHPDHRKKGSVARRLWLGMRRMVQATGGSCVLTAAISPEVEMLLMDAGAERLPGSHWILPMTTKETRCQRQ